MSVETNNDHSQINEYSYGLSKPSSMSSSALGLAIPPESSLEVDESLNVSSMAYRYLFLYHYLQIFPSSQLKDYFHFKFNLIYDETEQNNRPPNARSSGSRKDEWCGKSKNYRGLLKNDLNVDTKIELPLDKDDLDFPIGDTSLTYDETIHPMDIMTSLNDYYSNFMSSLSESEELSSSSAEVINSKGCTSDTKADISLEMIGSLRNLFVVHDSTFVQLSLIQSQIYILRDPNAIPLSTSQVILIYDNDNYT
jgi:hypothetical protein